MPHPCHNAYTSILARDVNAHARSTRRTWTLQRITQRTHTCWGPAESAAHLASAAVSGALWG